MPAVWTKPSDLAEGFWGVCFVVNLADFTVTMKEVRFYRGKQSWYSETMHGWFDFRQDIPCLVIPIEYPTITKEEFLGKGGINNVKD